MDVAGAERVGNPLHLFGRFDLLLPALAYDLQRKKYGKDGVEMDVVNYMW